MRTKDELLQEIKEAVDQGVITSGDVDAIFHRSTTEEHTEAPKKISVVQALFYITGIILFAAVLSVIGQTWEGGTALHLLLTVVLGSVIWVSAYMIGQSEQTDVRQGMADALLLTGSLLMITGGYIITNLFGDYGHVDFFQAVPALIVLAAVHAGLYYYVRRDLVYLMGIFLGVAALGSLAFGILRDADASGDAVVVTLIALAGLLSWATHVISRTIKTATHLQAAYDKLAIVISLIAMYVASFGDLSVVWYIALASAICGVFYLSIALKQKILLGTASTFLVIVTITVAFRYFSEFGTTTVLIISAFGISAVAVLASQLSKKYLS